MHPRDMWHAGDVRKRTVSTTYEDGDEWLTKHLTKPPRKSRSHDSNKAQRKPSRRLQWSSEEVDFLLELRREATTMVRGDEVIFGLVQFKYTGVQSFRKHDGIRLCQLFDTFGLGISRMLVGCYGPRWTE